VKHKDAHILDRLDDRTIPNDPAELRLFAYVRNESLRLPYLLSYYRSMGVDRFFFIDNASSDSTRDLLLAEKATHVFHTTQRFGDATRGQDWIDALLDRFGVGHWCICINADEIFIYPHHDRLALKDLCRYLDSRGASAQPALLLDMYGDGPIADASCRAGDDPLEVAAYFDTTLPEPGMHTEHPGQLYIRGGMRERVFGVRATLNKVPLFRYSLGVRLYEGFHFIDGVTASELLGGLLHFKYLDDFGDRAVEEARRGEHWCEAKEYKAYAEAITRDASINPRYEGSAKYEGWRQLVELGLMKNSRAFERYARDGGGGPKSGKE